MFQSASHGLPLEIVVAQRLHDDGDVISTREFNADDGLTESVRDAFVPPSELLSPNELAETVTNRAIIEHAVGVFMLAYELDADDAVELLKWGSRARGVTLGALARRVTEDLGGRASDREQPARCEPDLRAACDDVLFTAHGRVSPTSRPRHC